MDVRLTEEQRQMVILALADLAWARPGWACATREVVDLLSGRDMYHKLVAIKSLLCDAQEPNEFQTLRCAICGQVWGWDGKPILDGKMAYTPRPTARMVATCPGCLLDPDHEPSGNDTRNALAYRQRAKKGHTDS